MRPPRDFIDEVSKTIGENMRLARKEKGLTASDLSKFLSISTAYIGLIERGEHCPSLETFLRICNFFGKGADEMLQSKDGLHDKLDDKLNDKSSNKIKHGSMPNPKIDDITAKSYNPPMTGINTIEIKSAKIIIDSQPLINKFKYPRRRDI